VRELPRWRDGHRQQWRDIAPAGGHWRRRSVCGAANKAYRTTPLRALWQHPPYFHDGSAATLADVVAHYNRVRKLGLTADQQRDLAEYLKSL
jgi:cytochrome c peroxidase